MKIDNRGEKHLIGRWIKYHHLGFLEAFLNDQACRFGWILECSIYPENQLMLCKYPMNLPVVWPFLVVNRMNYPSKNKSCAYIGVIFLLILLMEEILHHLECRKPCKWWDKPPINCQLVQGLFHQQYPPKTLKWSTSLPCRIPQRVPGGTFDYLRVETYEGVVIPAMFVTLKQGKT